MYFIINFCKNYIRKRKVIVLYSVCFEQKGVDLQTVYDIDKDIYFVNVGHKSVARWHAHIKLRDHHKIHGE